ncbi:hypothetical protein O988_02815 [Pseudogymnoascus sp. VKM F-3808]|nr:hypothetical protein O988_02815 [Pseudogymnoascus sp. VKM F-3808]
MSPFPPELSIKIGRFLPPISSKYFSVALGYKSPDKDRAIWGAIFKNEEYASLATALGLELLLFETDLQQPRGSSTYILIDYIGKSTKELLEHKDVFLGSLKHYEMNEDGSIKLRDSNITLYIAGGIVSDKDQEDVLEPRRLFSVENGFIQSAYLRWNGRKCIKVEQSHIAGAWGKTATLKDVSDVCMVQLPKFPKKEAVRVLLRSDFPLREKLSVLTNSIVIYAREGYPWDRKK